MSADSLPRLEVSDLRVEFSVGDRKVTVVDGVSFHLHSGKTLALVGESGCGKSATALSLLRLIQPPGRIASGDVILRPRGGAAIEVLHLAEKDSDLYRVRGGLAAMVFQEPQSALSPVHSIGSQLIEAVRLHRTISRDGARAMAADMLSELGFEEPLARMQQYPHEFSGGMRQRAVIAMALLCRPELLIADEPTASLDVKLRERTLGVFRRMQAESDMAMLLITHDLSAVADIADHVAVMYCGEIVEYGTVKGVLAAPRHPYTQALLNSLSLDFPRSAGDRLRAIVGKVPQPGCWPSGCRFHTRCQDASTGHCDVGKSPQLRRLASDRYVACVKAAAYG